MQDRILFHRITDNGVGRHVYLLHGLFGNHLNFSALSAELKEEADFISVDLRNHGQSFHDAEMTYEVMADDLQALFEHTGKPPYAVIGHSMGGKLLMNYLLRKKLYAGNFLPIILDIYPRVNKGTNLKQITSAMVSADFNTLLTRRDIEDFLNRNSLQPEVTPFLMTNITASEKEPGKFKWRINISALHENLPHITGFPEADTLYDGNLYLIYGERSSYTAPDNEEVTRRIFPQSVFYPVAGAGHWVLHDKKAAALNFRIYRIAKDAFFFTIIRSDGLKVIRLGITPRVIEERLMSNHVIISESIKVSVGMEYEYLNQVPGTFDYLSVPRVIAQFKNALKEIGASKVVASDLMKTTKAVNKSISSYEAVTILFYKNHNIKITHQDATLFNLEAELQQPFFEKNDDFNTLNGFLTVYNAAPENVHRLNTIQDRDLYRNELREELATGSVNPNTDKLHLKEANSGRGFDFVMHEIPVTFSYPVDNCIHLKVYEDIPFDTPLELYLTRDDKQIFTVPLGIHEKKLSNSRYVISCHPPYFETYLHQKMQVLEKFVRYGLIQQIS
ncbi:hypothetical protein CHS0354_002027 [Potamilus streckersoni]|uniref:sn-1-specific diacylglycerol lipase ABHD11 n=1 Tax=Potamilus streckersoni TaxID=2493646 RepID=A0AAE0T6G5_9BIVA|nr:hypothetical protein CHS0354_002027 [Potamilus streckersoni]